MDNRIAGNTAIVTGGSRGIGNAIADRFARDGANITICSRDIENVKPAAEEISNENPEGATLGIEYDVTDYEAVQRMVDQTVNEFGGIDILVNNAGANFMAPFKEISRNGWEVILDINLIGTVNCSQVVGEYMYEGDEGNIINMSSNAGQQASPGRAHYGASKAGIIHFTKTLAVEWAPEDIRVNCIAPGFVATPGLASQMDIVADDIDRGKVDREIGIPAEVADVAHFLASPASSYVVGETITVQGRPPAVETPTQ